MKRGSHNLGRNGHGQLTILRVCENGEVRLHVGSVHVVLSEDQIPLLKDVLS